MKIEVIQGDITTLDVDAIVNAANTTLLGGGGVDAAIHKAAGDRLMQECITLHINGGCAVGEAKITRGWNLSAQYVIHTVGPDCRQHPNPTPDIQKMLKQQLANAYINSLKLADKMACKTIAFPNISTGIYGFDKKLASLIVHRILVTFKETQIHRSIEKVILCCFDSDNYLYCKKITLSK